MCVCEFQVYDLDIGTPEGDLDFMLFDLRPAASSHISYACVCVCVCVCVCACVCVGVCSCTCPKSLLCVLFQLSCQPTNTHTHTHTHTRTQTHTHTKWTSCQTLWDADQMKRSKIDIQWIINDSSVVFLSICNKVTYLHLSL